MLDEMILNIAQMKKILKPLKLVGGKSRKTIVLVKDGKYETRFLYS